MAEHNSKLDDKILRKSCLNNKENVSSLENKWSFLKSKNMGPENWKMWLSTDSSYTGEIVNYKNFQKPNKMFVCESDFGGP